MDRAQMEQILLGAGWTQEEIDQIKDDTVLGLIVTHEVSEAPAAGGAAAGGQAATLQDVPARDQMVADLLAAGHDQAELDALDDAALAALWQQEIGGQQMAEPLVVQATPAPATPRPAPAPIPAPVAAGGLAAMTPAQFSEAVRREALRQVRAAVAPVVRAQRALDAETHGRRVHALCERWLAEGRVLPAEIDEKSSRPNLRLRLLAASRTRVRRYGEQALSDFDAMVAEIEQRPAGFARRNFGEKLTVPAEPQPGLSPERRQQVLSYTSVGRAVLRDEAQKRN